MTAIHLRLTALTILLSCLPQFCVAAEYESQRPPAGERCFTSPTIERTINEVKAKIADPELAWMFENCYPNTLDTTVDYEVIDGKPDTFVITGDIDAMWLRDSTAQVWPYMPYITEDEKLRSPSPPIAKSQDKTHQAKIA